MITIFRDPIFGLLAQDEEGNRLPIWQRPVDTTHEEMWQEGKQRLTDAYPERQIRWYRMDPLPMEDVYVE